MASSLDFTCQIQKPATSSFVSANGPSMTVRLSPSNLTRAPFELGCSPSPASITPALTSSSLNLPIVVQQLRLRHLSRFGILRCLDHHHESHGCSPSTDTSNEEREIDRLDRDDLDGEASGCEDLCCAGHCLAVSLVTLASN